MHQDYTKSLPQLDRPEAFGQHFNAGIAYQQQESRGLLDSLAAMQSQSAADPGSDDRQQVMMSMATRLAAQVSIPGTSDLQFLLASGLGWARAQMLLLATEAC